MTPKHVLASQVAFGTVSQGQFEVLAEHTNTYTAEYHVIIIPGFASDDAYDYIVRRSGDEKIYNAENASGQGKVILGKNIVISGSSKKNILTQSAFYKEGTQTPNTDTVFVVQYDFDLNGQTVNVPARCVLEFNGGSLSNGTIVGDYTTVNAPICEIFKSNLIVDGDFNNVVAYPEWFGAKGDGVTDDTLAIQKCIDFTETIGGGTTQLGPKQYEISSLTIKTRTNLKGRGQGATILHSSTDFRVDNAVPDNTGIIVYPNNVGISVVSDMTILGTGYHQNGISVIDKEDSVSAPLPGQYGIFENRKALQTLQAYKDTTITNVYIGRCNYGIVCRRNGYRIVIDKCNVKYCIIGIEFSTTDSSINECYIEKCQRDGLFVYGGNNKVTNIKSIWNGAADPLNCYGIKIGGSRNSVVNCEAQDNYCSGIMVMGAAHILTNVLANGDGIANEESSPDKIAEIRAKDNVDGQGLTEWAVYTEHSCFNNCIATNYIYSPNRGMPKYAIRYDASHPQTLGTDIKIYGKHLIPLCKNPIYPDTPIRNTHTFNIIEENYDNTKGYKLQNETVKIDIPLKENIDTFNMGVICEFIPEEVVEREVVFSLFGFYGLYIQPFESDAEPVNGGKKLQLFPAIGDRYPSYNSFKMENVDVNKPIRVFMRANYLKTENNIAQIECLTCLWYYSTVANCYVYAISRNTVPYDLYTEGGVIQGDFRDYKADSLGFRRSVSYLNAHGATENTVYLRKLVATYDTCIPDTVSYPGYPLYNLNPEFAFDYLTLRTDRRNQYSGPTAKRPQYVSTGNFYYDESLNMPVCYIKGGWSPVGVVPIGNVTPSEGGVPVIENTISANDLKPGTIGAYTRGDTYKDTYNYPFGYCYVLTFCIIPNNTDYLMQICVPRSDNNGVSIPEAQKAVKYRTKVDGVWSDWYPSSEINNNYMYISNNRVVCLNSPKLIDGSFAKYTDVVMDDVVTKCLVRHVLVKEDTQGIDPMIALIARPNKYDSNSNAANGGIVKDSVHVTFHKSYLEYGIFNNGSWSRTRINYPTITFPEGKTEIEVVVGFEITDNDTIVFTLPDGSIQSATVSGIRTHSGKYFTFEHYIYSSPDEVSDKYVLPITGIYCKDASGKELIDDFRRENGPLGVAPTGQAYIQYNPFQTKDTFPLNRLGVATWELPANVTEYALRLGNYRGQKLTWSGGIVVKDYNDNILTSPYLVPANATLNNMVKVSSGETGGIMELENKYSYDDSVGSTSEGILKPLKYDYNLKSISSWFSGTYFNPVAFGDPSTNQCPITGNLEEIVSCLSRNNVTQISIPNCPNLEGDIAVLGSLSTVTYLNITRCAKLTGSIANLGGMTNLSALLFYNVSNVTGSIEDFVAAQRAAGRTTASGIRVTGGGTGITYNGSSIGYTEKTLSWTSDSINLV